MSKKVGDTTFLRKKIYQTKKIPLQNCAADIKDCNLQVYMLLQMNHQEKKLYAKEKLQEKSS